MAPGARFAKIKKRVSQWTKRWDSSSSSSVAVGDTTTTSIPSFSAFSMLRPLSRVPTNSDGSAKSVGKPSAHNADPGYTHSSVCLPAPPAAAVESSASTRMPTRASTRTSTQTWSQFANENTILETSLPDAAPAAADWTCPAPGSQTSGTPTKRKRGELDADTKPDSGVLQKCTSHGFDEWWSRTIKTACADGARTCGRGSALTQDTGDQEMLTMAWAISQFSCHLCGKRIPVDAASLVRKMQAIIPGDASSPSGSVYSSFKCEQCAIMNCLACARATPHPLSDDQIPPAKLPSITWCCDMGRIMLILSLCCGVDYTVASPPPSPTPPLESGRHSFGFFKTLKDQKAAASASAPDMTSEPPSKKHLHKVTTKKVFPKKLAKTATPKGVGYGSMASIFCPTGMMPAPSIAQSSLLEEDCKYEMYFRMLCHLLSHSEHTPELSSPAASSFTLLYHILSRSPLMTKAAELLLNTSIEDMTKRHGLYEVLCQFLSILGNNDTLARLVTEPRRIFPEEEQVAQICFMSPEMIAAMRTSFDGKGKHKVRETSESLAGLLRRISGMCQFVLQKSAVHSSDYLSVDGIQTLSMCRRLISLSERLVPAPAPPVASMRNATITRANTRKASSAADAKSQADLAAAWHREHCVEDVEDEKMMENNYFENHTQVMQHSPKGRMKRLVNEINMLRSSLPEGIFVRHGSGRLDTMKVLIIGPKGTPYENGLFEFDLFCSNNFPQSPPYMRLRTTGGGQVRFNPNLYADGTGTWAQGQSWEPDQSTLLQVLVSIQAMIFCEEPYYNEPGREEKRNPQASAKENAFLQKSTVQHAMLYWLNMLSPYGPTDTNASSPQLTVWEDVVRKHFSLHGQTIMQVVSKWGVKDDGVRQLRDTLRQHAFLE